jgi:hypothetical protein
MEEKSKWEQMSEVQRAAVQRIADEMVADSKGIIEPPMALSIAIRGFKLPFIVRKKTPEPTLEHANWEVPEPWWQR